MYDPVLGLMLSPDNYVSDATSTVAFNRYLYANGNPLKYTDPSGELTWYDIGAGLMIVGGVVLCATGVGGPLGLALIVGGVSHFGKTLDTYSEGKMSWNDASNYNGIDMGINISITPQSKKSSGGNDNKGPGYNRGDGIDWTDVDSKRDEVKYQSYRIFGDTREGYVEIGNLELMYYYYEYTQTRTISKQQEEDDFLNFGVKDYVPYVETTFIDEDWGALTPGPFVIYPKGGSNNPHYSTHEPGHVAQFLILGPAGYVGGVVIPSLLSSGIDPQRHKYMPWEMSANQLYYWYTGKSDPSSPIYSKWPR